MEESMKFKPSFEYKLIYVFRINDDAHTGYLKIGDATIHTNKNYDELLPNSHDLNSAARNRIDSYTGTAGIVYELLYTEIAVYKNKNEKSVDYGRIFAFRDHEVHNVLKRSSIENKKFNTNKKQNEWFKCDLETAKNAIKAVKEGKTALEGYQISDNQSPIVLRPEQEEAIKQTIKQFATNHHMLWNAKMRFGKTLSALELVKRMKFNKTIIITHRPDVDKGWFEDFLKIFYEKDSNYLYGSKQFGKTIEELLSSGKPFVYFASIQDLRGSEKAGGKFDKNDNVFKTKWDLVVTDEAHEGTQTELGKTVRDLLIRDDNYDLSLSGTPFNLFDLYASENTFTWDYIMEQKAKYDWMKDPEKLGDSNPYEELPKLNIYTYQLEKFIKTDFDLEDKAFNFKEFFRVWTGDKDKDHPKSPDEVVKGKFVHEDAVKAFLDLLVTKNETTNYPFSTEEYRDYFRHTLWMIPGVKEASALTELLKAHPVFGSGQFNIVNVAGDGDYDYKEEQKARDKLSKAMTDHPENTRTITLSCGRLTTGVTVPEWTGVLMLYGTYMTDAKSYLQTIFRVQSPGNINGKIKENCYVFDFAPDRTLRVVYDSVKKMSIKREPAVNVSCLMGEFLNFCPVIAMTDVSYMKTLSTNELLQEVKRVYAERVVESGFDDRCLYDDLKLKQLDKDALDKFEKLREIVGKTNQTKKTDVKVNENDLTEEERAELEGLEKQKKEKKVLTEEEKKRLEELKKLQDKKRTAISILRAISIRIPLLVYGMDIDYSSDVRIDEFADTIDDASWEEFMPKGVTKKVFKEFIEYYDKDIFIKACKTIRVIAKQCDDLKPTERIKKLVELFAKFKNPDKETVLTPWRVVNMHMSRTIGGYCFYDENFEFELEEPRFVDTGEITKDIFDDEGKVLEINSKTGLYPLYVAYTFYKDKVKDNEDSLSLQDCKKVWDSVVENNIYSICKTEMAKQITRRTLLGYTKGKINAHAFDDLINQMKEKQQQLVEKILRPSFWSKGGNEMKFNAVVGNPPYQRVIENTSDEPIYCYFMDASYKLSNLVSLITPGRFLFNAGKTSKEWNKKMLNDPYLKICKYFPNSSEIFPNTNINGGIVITVRNQNIKGDPIKFFSINPLIENILSKVVSTLTFESIQKIFYLQTKFNLRELKKDYPSVFNRLGDDYTEKRIVSSAFEKMGEVFSNVKENDDFVEILGIENHVRISKYINKKYLDTFGNIDKYKVILSSADGASGVLSQNKAVRIIGLPEIGKVGEGYTQTFISIGDFDSEYQAANLMKYLKTKFARFMVGTKKATNGLKYEMWGNVPLQNFSSDSDINWGLSIKEIDQKLYKKYKLTTEEIGFIEEKILEMR